MVYNVGSRAAHNDLSAAMVLVQLLVYTALWGPAVSRHIGYGDNSGTSSSNQRATQQYRETDGESKHTLFCGLTGSTGWDSGFHTRQVLAAVFSDQANFTIRGKVKDSRVWQKHYFWWLPK